MYTSERLASLRGATLKRIFQCDVVESDSCGSDIHKGSTRAINLKKKGRNEGKEKAKKKKKKKKSSAPTFYKMEA